LTTRAPLSSPRRPRARGSARAVGRPTRRPPPDPKLHARSPPTEVRHPVLSRDEALQAGIRRMEERGLADARGSARQRRSRGGRDLVPHTVDATADLLADPEPGCAQAVAFKNQQADRARLLLRRQHAGQVRSPLASGERDTPRATRPACSDHAKGALRRVAPAELRSRQSEGSNQAEAQQPCGQQGSGRVAKCAVAMTSTLITCRPTGSRPPG
jgi:hypothetical protein